MVVLVTCKNEDDPIKNEGSRVLTIFSQLLVNGKFFKRSRAANSVQSRIWPKIRTRTRLNSEEDPIKNEGARVLTRLYVVFFSDAQGQLSPKSAVEFCRNSNSSKLL